MASSEEAGIPYATAYESLDLVDVPAVQPGSAPQRSAEPTDPGPVRMAEAARLVGLMDRCAQGDQDAFAALYDKTASRVYGLALRVLRSADHAAEVAQEVYAEVWREAGRYSADRGSVLGWMTTIAHRRAVDRVRSVSSQTARDTRYAVHAQARDVDQVWDGVEQRLDAERVRKALASLTPIQREALTLAYFGGYTQTQIAGLLTVPLGTVKTRIRDGLIGLRQALGAAG